MVIATGQFLLNYCIVGIYFGARVGGKKEPRVWTQRRTHLKRKSSTKLLEPLSPGLTGLNVHVLCSNYVGTGALSIRVSLAERRGLVICFDLIIDEVVDDFVEALCGHQEL